MLVIIDYGVGNVRSVINAFRYIGSDIQVSCEPQEIRRSEGLILPGVGASGYAMQKLAPLAEVIRQEAQAGKPLLGICVGYQLLFEESYEMGTHRCLGLIAGKVVPIPKTLGLTIPHMGWNYVEIPAGMALLEDMRPGRYFAFAHSFYAEISDSAARVAKTHYGLDLPATVQKNNIFGCQFHPEKSAADGLKFLKNFAAYCRKGRCPC
jgi:glutamine amidotransferase